MRTAALTLSDWRIVARAATSPRVPLQLLSGAEQKRRRLGSAPPTRLRFVDAEAGIWPWCPPRPKRGTRLAEGLRD